MGSTQIYGAKEHRFAEPFADRLLDNAAFRQYILSRTKFGNAIATTVLIDEMLARRSKNIRYWWKNAFTEKCRCFGCSGSETDVFAVLTDDSGLRFAVHAEVKNPDDSFDPNNAQGERYPIRAACWASNAPPTIPPHEDFCTILLCSEGKVAAFADEARHFDAVITFEELARDFIDATPATITPAAPLSRFALGMRIFHGKFGYGTIALIEGNKLEIEFEHAGRKRVLDSFVSIP